MEEINNNQEGQEEERDVEVMEFSLTSDEIEELITKLECLKESKEQFSFDIDEGNELVVSFEDDEEEGIN